MDRHQARHRRAVRRRADPRAAARRADRSRLSGALHQRALAGDPTIRARPTMDCSRATPTASRWPSTRPTGALADATRADIAPALVGTFKLADGREARAGVPADRRALPRRRLRPGHGRRRRPALPPTPSAASPRELAHAAFEQQITLDIPWTDWAGRRHEKTDRPPGRRCTPCAASRPMPTASRPAACCISCRSCWARSIAPAASATRRPIPSRRRRPQAAPASRATCSPARRCQGRRSASRTGPEDLLVDADGTPQRIDKAYSWDAPLAAHGLMHMVITNAAQRRSLSDRRAVHVHGQHELELVDEHAGDAART